MHPEARSIGRLLALAGWCAALSGGCHGAPLNGPRPAPRVDHLGSMREMIESGSAAGRVALSPLLGLRSLYALGPLEGLRGEILVWDGTPFIGRIDAGQLRVAADPDARAPFLVWSSVREWRELAVPAEAGTLAALEEWLPDAARAVGIDPGRPFAFLVLGAVRHATIHVVDLAPEAALTRESHDAARRPINLSDAPVQMLGFFAPDEAGARGVWLHHSSRIHVHLRTQLGTALGHVDDFSLAPGALLRIAWR